MVYAKNKDRERGDLLTLSTVRLFRETFFEVFAGAKFLQRGVILTLAVTYNASR